MKFCWAHPPVPSLSLDLLISRLLISRSFDLLIYSKFHVFSITQMEIDWSLNQLPHYILCDKISSASWAHSWKFSFSVTKWSWNSYFQPRAERSWSLRLEQLILQIRWNFAGPIPQFPPSLLISWSLDYWSLDLLISWSIANFMCFR